MEFFIDTGIIEEIREAVQWGIVDGVTTNPTLIAQSGRTQKDVIQEIATVVDGPISAEVIATEYNEMIKEAKELSEIHTNVVVKLPMTSDGIRACFWCTENSINTNVTLIFSVNQALLAAKAGATYVSPFVGRLDDIGHDGMTLIEEIRTVFDNYGYPTKILSASIRHSVHVRDSALIGADVGTMPFKVMKQLFNHALTEKGLSAFLADHEKANK